MVQMSLKKKGSLLVQSIHLRKAQKNTTLISALRVYFHWILIHFSFNHVFFFPLCSTSQFFTTNLIILQLDSRPFLVLDLRSTSIKIRDTQGFVLALRRAFPTTRDGSERADGRVFRFIASPPPLTTCGRSWTTASTDIPESRRLLPQASGRKTNGKQADCGLRQ